MSTESAEEERIETDAILEHLQRWYHVPALFAVLFTMVWYRLQAYDEFVRDGNVFFRGNDAYYHYRATMYSVENWPRQLYGDPWTHFPFGNNIGNFGSLMDQSVATAALVVGLGDPSSRQVAQVAVVAPAIFGALCVVAVYFLGKFLSNSRLGGLGAAAVLAFLPQSSWVMRSTVGFYDHHVAEALMMSLAMLGFVYAIATVRRERPIYEQVLDRDWDGLAPSVKASALAGLLMGLYLHTWAPGILLVGIFGTFLVIAMSVAVLWGNSPEHLAFAGVVSMLTTALVVLPWTIDFQFENATLSMLQLLLALAVAAGAGFLGAMARQWERRDLDPNLYPVVVGALIAVAFAAIWLLVPEVYSSIEGGVRRMIPSGQSDTLGTVSEAQPTGWDNFGETFYDGYGFTFFTAIVGAAWMFARSTLSKRPRSEYLLVALWFLFTFSMAMSQVRFHYYLVLPVAVLNGWLLVRVLDVVSLPSMTDVGDIEAYQVLAIVAVVAILFVPIASPIAATTAADNAEQTGPGSVVYWQDNLDWMSENTPQPGDYGGADNNMSYYGPFDEISDYEYPEGAYGVMSWWDYGHWITVEGERIPVANPFQQGPRAASAYLQETNESRANMYLEALPSDVLSGSEFYNASPEELQDAIDARTEQEANEETRYVMIDSQMAGGKFSAITEWTGPGYSAYTGPSEYASGNDTMSIVGLNDQYDSTMLSRMYFNDGSLYGEADASALEHYRLVRESPTDSAVLSIGQRTQSGTLTPFIVGMDAGTLANYYPSVYQAAFNPQNPQFTVYQYRQESAVKTYERVEGATITGEAEPNQTVQAVVRMETNTDREFLYAQSTEVGADGTFELTVPYATTNELGPADGYTDSSVLANGSYTVMSGQPIENNGSGDFQQSGIAENVSVPESAIYGGDSIAVDLEPVEDGNGTDGGNGTDDGTGADDGSTDGTTNGTDASGGDASGSAPAASIDAVASSAAASGSASTALTDVTTTALTDVASSLGTAAHSITESIAAARVAG